MDGIGTMVENKRIYNLKYNNYTFKIIISCLTIIVSLSILIYIRYNTENILKKNEINYVHEGTLASNQIYDKYFSQLPDFKDLNGDGFRFVANPTFSLTQYGLALSKPTSDYDKNGILYIYVNTAKNQPTAKVHHFHVDSARYENFSKELDNILDRRSEKPSNCLDGTTFAFERLPGTRVTSGANIGTCSEYYDMIAKLVLDNVRQWSAIKELPPSESWSVLPE